MDSPNLYSDFLYSPFLNEYNMHDVPFIGDASLPPLPMENIGADDDMGWMEIYPPPNDHTVGSSGAVPNVEIHGETSIGQVETAFVNQIMTNNTNSCFMSPLVDQKWYGHQNHFPVGSSDHANHHDAFGINGQNLAVQAGLGNTDYMGMMNNAAMGTGMIISSPNFSPPTIPIISLDASNQELTNFVGDTLNVDNSHQLTNHCEIRVTEGGTNMGNPTTNNRNILVEHFPNKSTKIPPLTEGRQEASASLKAAINMEGGNVKNPLLSDFPNEPVDLAPPSDCPDCQILKVITHQNAVGQNVMKLEIHGSLVATSFFHAIITNNTNQTHPILQKLDFLNQNYDEVEQFLSQYLIDQLQQGFTITDDQHSRFYKILCMGSGSVSAGGNGINEAGPSNLNTPQKKSRKEQIEMVERLTLEKVRSVVHHRRADAAKQLGICVSSLSNFLKRCGKSDYSWPSRKIRSQHRQIEKARKRGEDVTSLQAKLDQLYAPFY